MNSLCFRTVFGLSGLLCLLGASQTYADSENFPVFLGPASLNLACTVLGEGLMQSAEKLITEQGLTRSWKGPIRECDTGTKVTPGRSYIYHSRLRVPVEGGTIECLGHLHADLAESDGYSDVLIRLDTRSCLFLPN